MQTYVLEIIDNHPAARIYVDGVKTSASILYMTNVDQSHLGKVAEEMKDWIRRDDLKPF